MLCPPVSGVVDLQVFDERKVAVLSQWNGQPTNARVGSRFSDSGTSGRVALRVLHIVMENKNIAIPDFLEIAQPREIVWLVDCHGFLLKNNVQVPRFLVPT